MNRLSLWMAIAATVGILMGFLSPVPQRTAKASHLGLQIDFTPPALASNKNAKLTQAWHDADALDWSRYEENGSADYRAELRGFAFKSGSTNYTIAYINRHDSASCKRTRADFWDVNETSYGGAIFFTHVLPDDNVWTVYFNHTSGGNYNSHRIGTR